MLDCNENMRLRQKQCFKILISVGVGLLLLYFIVSDSNTTPEQLHVKSRDRHRVHQQRTLKEVIKDSVVKTKEIIEESVVLSQSILGLKNTSSCEKVNNIVFLKTHKVSRTID